MEEMHIIRENAKGRHIVVKPDFDIIQKQIEKGHHFLALEPADEKEKEWLRAIITKWLAGCRKIADNIAGSSSGDVAIYCTAVSLKDKLVMAEAAVIRFGDEGQKEEYGLLTKVAGKVIDGSGKIAEDAQPIIEKLRQDKSTERLNALAPVYREYRRMMNTLWLWKIANWRLWNWLVGLFAFYVFGIFWADYVHTVVAILLGVLAGGLFRYGVIKPERLERRIKFRNRVEGLIGPEEMREINNQL